MAAGRGVAVLGQVVAAAGVEHEVVEPVQQRRQAARAPAGTSTASAHPDSGKLSGAGLAGPNRLSTARKLGAPDADRRSIDPAQRDLLAERARTNWYCTKPWRP